MRTLLTVDVVKVEGATGDYSTDLDAKGRVAAEMLWREDYDFGFVHIKAVDDAGHDKDLAKKVRPSS